MWHWLSRRLAAGSLALVSIFPQLSKVSFMGSQPETAAENIVNESGVEAAEISKAVEDFATKPPSGAVRVAAGAAAGGVAAGGVLLAARGCEEAGIAGRAVTEVAESTSAVRAAEGARIAESARATDGFLEGTVTEERIVATPSSMGGPLEHGLIVVPVSDGSTAAAKAANEAKIALFDQTGRAVSQDSIETAIAQEHLERRLTRITARALQNLPENTATLTDEQIQQALVKALGKEPKLTYEFNVSEGKLKLKFKTARGEINGDISAVAVVRKAATIAASTYVTYRGFKKFESGTPEVPRADPQLKAVNKNK